MFDIALFARARARAPSMKIMITRVSDNSRGGTLLNNKKIQMRAVHEIQKIAEIKSCSAEKRKKRERGVGGGTNVTLLLESIIRR